MIPSFYTGPAGPSDTMLFLTVDTPEQVNMVYELWDGYSGAPGLLGAAPQAPSAGRKAGGYIYDKDRRVYVDAVTGRDVTQDQLVRYVKNVSYESSLRMKKSTQQLIAGIILLSVWYSGMRDLMRALYKTVWTLSIGGFVFDDDIQRNLFYLFVLSQFNYLDNFTEQLYTGEQDMNGFAMTRAGLYGSYGNGLWQNIGLVNAETNGYTEAIRILGENEDHCSEEKNPGSGRPGCIELAALGWIPVREMVPISETICYTACKCRIKLR